MEKQNFTRKEVIELIQLLSECGDILIDVASNENTDWDGESLLEMAEEWKERQNQK